MLRYPLPSLLWAVLVLAWGASRLPAQDHTHTMGSRPAADTASLTSRISSCRRTTAGCVARPFPVFNLGASTRPVVDGRLDDPIWARAMFLDDFTQREPTEGARPRQRTEVAVVAGPEALFVAARLASAPGEAIRATRTRRDDLGNAEYFLVSLDPYGNRRSANSFAVTAAGVRVDFLHPDDSDFPRDYSYNPVWSARVHRTDTGWTAELEIPYSQLRFTDSPTPWGINFRRVIPATGEDMYWIPIPRRESGWASWFGDLADLTPPGAGRPAELLPYVAGQTTLTSASLVSPADPFRSTTAWNARAGFDLKLGLGSNLTLDATVNPDFGQVEADPAEVNLTAFPTFFPERRPFFTEGSQLLTGLPYGHFYSRRIGAAPRGGASGDFVERPENSSILGAAKLSGRLPSGLSMAALVALTDEEFASVADTAADAVRRIAVEPRAAFGAVRLQQEFGRSRSTAGLLLTGVHRDLERGAGLATLLPRSALTGALDGQLRLAGGAYAVAGYAGFSRVAGEADAIAGMQRSSVHYFQRPDATHLSYDPARTHLGGWAARVRLDKTSGRSLVGGLGVQAESPGFNLNDLGRYTSADNLNASLNLTLRQQEPRGMLRNYWFNLYANGGWTFGGERTGGSVQVEAHATTLGFWHSFATFNVTPRAVSDFLTRGGPLMGTPASWTVGYYLENNTRAATRWVTHTTYQRDELDGWRVTFSGSLTARPTPALGLSVAPNILRGANTQQWVATRSGGNASTFGQRYVFARLDQSIVSVQLRANYALTPDLTIEGYAEPFIATGAYDGYGELAAPGALRLRAYGTDGTTIAESGSGAPRQLQVTDGNASFTLTKQDFRSVSWRSNLVARWEWRPGSTLFLVWQRDGGATDLIDRPRAASLGGLDDGLRTPGRNALLVKVAYWMTPLR